MNDTIEKYQQKFARFLGAERAFAFWKGRVALYALLRALEVSPGDEVILPGYTCVMNVNPIKYDYKQYKGHYCPAYVRLSL